MKTLKSFSFDNLKEAYRYAKKITKRKNIVGVVLKICKDNDVVEEWDDPDVPSRVLEIDILGRKRIL